ncbi:MAG: nucleoside hydrolase [Candidatus Woesearchaeota archaeon]
MKYIIDTDPGIDDAIAIMLAVKSGLNILGITTVSGNTTIESTTRNAQYVLGLLNSNDIPIYSGSERPLNRELVKAVVHGKSGLEGLDPSNNVALSENAVDKILSMIRENNDVTIIALGPLTNIARAIIKEPDTIRMVKEIIVMGGAIKVAGNKSRVAEYNFFVDPEAADIVLRFPVRKTLVPLDACNEVTLLLDDFKKIKGSLQEPILMMINHYIKNISSDEGINSAPMYDPLTVYYAINPSACTIKEYDILVETKGVLTRGMTVADFRNKPDRVNPIDVVIHINSDKFRSDLIHYLSKT